MPMRRRYVSPLVASLALLALSSVHPADAHKAHHPNGNARRGIAVWYGEDRQGQTMANGRAFDQWAMTGASVRFPLGTRVRVTDVATRKSVTVTIADHTIPKSHVLIDLSRGAAHALGIETEGKARVEVLPIGYDRNQARTVTSSNAPKSASVTEGLN
jgi:rare lipoprotein A